MQNTVRKFLWTTLMVVWVSVAAIADEDIADEAVEKSASPAKFAWSELIQAPPTTADQQQRDRYASFTEALANE